MDGLLLARCKDGTVYEILKGLKAYDDQSDVYYEFELKGRSKTHILKEIRSLRKNIKNQKEIIEYSRIKPTQWTAPSPFVSIEMNRLYLKEAKRALEEIGEIYKPSRIEKKGLKFNRISMI